MEIIFQSTKLAGFDEATAYQAVFFGQVAAVIVALGVTLNRALVHVVKERNRGPRIIPVA
jgi:hypothetical protein